VTSDVVFIGKVELIEPMFLSRWNTTSPASLQVINEAYVLARQNPSRPAMDRLRNTYLKTFPALSDEQKRRVQTAQTLSGITSAFYSTLSQGMRVRLRVKTLFKYQDGDDDDDAPKTATATVPKKPGKDDDDDRKGGEKTGDKKQPAPPMLANDKDTKKEDPPDVIEVESPFDDCAVDFQEGETYIVYATSDEDSNVLSTTSCDRTRKISDAGEDLGYLFFFKNRPEESTRLDGFVSAQAPYDAGNNLVHDADSIDSPVPGVALELRKGDEVRYTQSDSLGYFRFDGLGAGNYAISAYAKGYPVEKNPLGFTQSISVKAKTCPRQIVWLPRRIN
jgi:Carboxypeptidase regulatory-like domain